MRWTFSFEAGMAAFKRYHALFSYLEDTCDMCGERFQDEDEYAEFQALETFSKMRKTTQKLVCKAHVNCLEGSVVQ